MVLDCQNGMPKLDNVKSFTTLENMALLLHTANLEKNEYGTDMYFATDTFLCEEVLHSILEKTSFYYYRFAWNSRKRKETYRI